MKLLLSGLLLVLVSSVEVDAQTPIEQLVDDLRQEGYDIDRVQRTWLGRIRVVSRKGPLVREIVIRPATGEIMRDLEKDTSIPVRERDDDDDDDFKEPIVVEEEVEDEDDDDDDDGETPPDDDDG